MNHHQKNHNIPAPCIIDDGTIVNKEDIKRLLNDLGHVRYIHTIDSQFHSEGKGWIVEVFNDPQQSTLVANNNLYLNIQSFDCLQLSKSENNETYFDLIQDNRQLRLIPIAQASTERDFSKNIDAETIEAMMTEVLSARFDVQFDDEEF
jgi:hypothetical protein